MTMSLTPVRKDPNRGLKSALVGSAAGFATLFVLGAIVGYLDGDAKHTARGLADVQPVVWIGIAAIATVVSFAIGTRWMMGIDELAQRAHYEAWYWGGSIGLALMTFLILAAPALARFVDLPALYAPLTRYTGDASGFVAGVLASVLTLSIGYGAWWLLFWLRKR